MNTDFKTDTVIRDNGALRPPAFALWEIVSVVISCLIAEWVVLAFVGANKFVLAIPVALWLPVTRVERVLLVTSALLVLVVELLNTSIERTVDRIGVERHELSRRAKDLGSAAVLVATLIMSVVWLAIAVPALLGMLG